MILCGNYLDTYRLHADVCLVLGRYVGLVPTASVEAIRRHALLAQRPDLRARLLEASDEYIHGRFDGEIANVLSKAGVA